MPYDAKTFVAVANSEGGEVSSETVFHYHQDGDVFWADYSGGEVLKGFMIGRAFDDGRLEFHYQHLNRALAVRNGRCISYPKHSPDGRLELHENWQWLDGDRQRGTSILRERQA